MLASGASGILEGITRDAVIGLARELGIDVREVPLTKHDVYIADECFLTGTAAEVIPVVKVDSRTIGDGAPGKITRQLMERFHKLARRQGNQLSELASFSLTQPDSVGGDGLRGRMAPEHGRGCDS